MKSAQTSASWAFNAIVRRRTLARRATSFASTERGSARSDGHTWNVLHTRRAQKLSCRTAHSRYTSGTLRTRMRARGEPRASSPIALPNCSRNLWIGVMSPIVGTQTSLAPIRMVTYEMPSSLMARTCWRRSFTPAPVTASLAASPAMLGSTARMRR
jgi:hypothetical protein